MRPITVRPASRADLVAFYGATQARKTVVARVGDVDGEIVGCGGVAFVGGHAVVFCDLLPAARRYKVAMVKGAREVIDTVRASGCRVMGAYLDETEPGAERWVRSLGFEPTDEPGYFRWSAAWQE